MRTRVITGLAFLTVAGLAASFGTAAATPAANTPAAQHGVHLLGEYVVPNDLVYGGTAVGGLSGIDRDLRTGQYVLVSDDRSAKAPARFYTAKIDVDASGVHGVDFTGVHTLQRPDGQPYPPITDWSCTAPQAVCDRDGTVDPEDVRVDPWTGNVTWSQEGERIVPATGAPTLLDPSIRSARPSGAYASQLPLPANERMHATENGPRQNYTLEGLTYAAAGTLVVSELEDPRYEDGPVPDASHGAVTRMTVQTRGGAVLAQYEYQIDPLFAPSPSTADTNGVSSMVAVDPLDPTRYLMLERAYVTGVGNKVRVYEIDTRGATNVQNMASLASAQHVTPVRKKLLVDLDDVGLPKVDNVEGISWGPRLPDGSRTLVLVSDNNFSASQITQVIALSLR